MDSPISIFRILDRINSEINVELLTILPFKNLSIFVESIISPIPAGMQNVKNTDLTHVNRIQ